MDHVRFGSKRRLRGVFATAPVAMLTLITLLAVALPAPALAETAKKTPSPSAPLDINEASADELTALPGIGPAMAQRIVAFREEHGPFRRAEDLMRVKGIGEKSFEKLRPSIKVSKKK